MTTIDSDDRPAADPVADALARFPTRAPTVLTGDRPTGDLHVGHLLGSLRNRVALQRAGAELTVVIADYQVIADRDDVGPVHRRVLSVLADYLACGIDPDQAVIFPHSAVPELNQLMLPFLSLVSDAELRRNPTVKGELAASARSLTGLLLTYPVHQAADILFCHADLVPVGADQLPHLELTRQIARRFNDRYQPVFTVPSPLLSEVPMLLGTDGAKMSKSRGNTIPLGASADETAAIIRRAVTDADRHISYAPEQRPGVSALVALGAGLTGTDPVAFADRIGAGGSARLKQVVTEVVNEQLLEHRSRRAALLADPALLAGVLANGIAAARATAIETLSRVRAVMGMDYLSGSPAAADAGAVSLPS